MKKKNFFIGLSMMAFAGASLASCGSVSLTETDFTVAEPTKKDGVEVFEGEEYYTEKMKYFSIVNEWRKNPYEEEVAPYVEKLTNLRDSILKDYESYTVTVYTKDKKTKRVTYEKSVLDFKTFNVFYYLNSYIEKNGKKEQSINLLSKAYRKENVYTVVSDVSLDSFEYYTNEMDDFGAYIPATLTGTQKLYTTFESPCYLSNDGEYAVTDEVTTLLIPRWITGIQMKMDALSISTDFTISKDYSYSYFEYVDDNGWKQTSLIEDYLLKSATQEYGSYSLVFNYSLNKEKAFGDKEEPKLDGYEEYEYTPEKETWEIYLALPLCARPFQYDYMYSGYNASYKLLFNDDVLINKFQSKQN